jgi:uncharacterized PurR-regulated membrane protein YhhQ (DUF165 family)
MNFGRYRFTLLYVALIPLINWAFAHTHFFTLPDGGTWSPFSIVVGLILIVRDFSQREIGHWVFIPLMIGCFLSYYLAAPIIALASATAFLVSEVVDWIVFTYTKARLSTRVLVSATIAIPIDSVIFLTGAEQAVPGIFSWWTLGTMLTSKMLGAIVVYYMLRVREREEVIRVR